MIGTPKVTVTPAAGGAAVDITCLLDQVSIQHGRSDTDNQPDASSCTVDFSLHTPDVPWPSQLDVGATMRVTVTIGGTEIPRFTGRITDLAQGWEDAGPETPNQAAGQAIATGVLAELGRRVVGASPFPQQLDGARIAAIMAAAGVTLDPLWSDPGTVQILPRDVDSQPALDIAQATANDAGGLLYTTTSGAVRYGDADHRRNAVPALALDACDVLVTPTWRRTTEGLVNVVAIGYGATPAGGDQPRYTAQRDDSIAVWGTFGFSATTQLAALADAAAMGQLLLTRNIAPVWIVSALPVDMGGLDEARTATLLQLDLGDLISVTGLPAAGSVPTSAMLWLEGWQETLTGGEHSLDLVVSGYCRTVPPPRWNDVPPTQTWDNTPASLTWDGASCLGPTPNLGRWDDIPASVRWDQVPAAQTWDSNQFIPA